MYEYEEQFRYAADIIQGQYVAMRATYMDNYRMMHYTAASFVCIYR